MLLKSSLDLLVAHRVTIYCPASREAWLALLAGDPTCLEQDPTVAALLAVLRTEAEFGALGPYRNVFEVSGGHESFTPGPDARPAFGSAEERSTTPSVVITTYVSRTVTDVRLAELVAALAASHPWELPVIEVCEVRILAPAAAESSVA